MRNWVPLLSWTFDKPSGVTTPLAVKIVAVLQGLLIVNLTVATSEGPSTSTALITLSLWTITACLMTALWNMKRWVVLVLVAYLLVYLFRALPAYLVIAPRGVIAGVVARSLGIVAGTVYWKRMTWR